MITSRENITNLSKTQITGSAYTPKPTLTYIQLICIHWRDCADSWAEGGHAGKPHDVLRRRGMGQWKDPENDRPERRLRRFRRGL